MFLLFEDGTWRQPTFAVKKATQESELKQRILAFAGRECIAAYGLCQDNEAPKYSILELPLLVKKYQVSVVERYTKYFSVESASLEEAIELVKQGNEDPDHEEYHSTDDESWEAKRK